MKNAEMSIVVFESDDVIATSVPTYVPGSNSITNMSSVDAANFHEMYDSLCDNSEYYIYKSGLEYKFIENISFDNTNHSLTGIDVGDAGDVEFVSSHYVGDGWYIYDNKSHSNTFCTNTSHHPFN